MAKKKQYKNPITKRHRDLIRGPGGRFASEEQLIDVYYAKQANPKASYKELSRQWINENHPAYTPLERDFQGELISERATREINQAASQLNISRERAKSLYLENKLIKQVQGHTPLFAVGGDVDAYFQRVENFSVRVKAPGEKKYHTYTTRKNARIAIDSIKSQIWEQLRALYGNPVPSDEIPIIKIIDKHRPGKFLPEVQLYNFDKYTTMGDLDDDEREELEEQIKSGAFSNTSKTTKQNETQNRKYNRNRKPKRANTKTKTK